MKGIRQLSMLFIVIAILASSLGFSTQTAQAASCSYYHTVRHGQSLSSIGAWYGVSWKSIAKANGITSPWTIYSGQVLCIPSGGYYYKNTNYNYVSYAPSWKNWTFSVVGVVEDSSVTIKTANFPDNMLYSAEIGCPSCGVAAVKVADVDSDAGGTFKKVFTIPVAFSGVNNLWVRLTQVNNGDDVQVAFSNNTTFGSGGTYYPTYYSYNGKYYYNIPTISIVSVVRNSSVTIRTHNFPANKTFNVLMNEMGTRGRYGYNVGSFNSGNGASQTLTFNIPAELRGNHQIAIRTQSTSGGFFSYNWFYNNTAY